ncbi:hypothetical protein [Actinomadura sp. WMMB 499]|uniref:hypothetical protein n=1 Tax=Actinomadura sp. WMMB 499 TaxID=1219491 RepID=UPI001248C32E|nr:hypothetical protein [Actinomadura sp. WMMB 499]QFG22751.1 hypothetical protein F7P10_18130 [Actinomadura sp. WMMB 499]
MIPFLLRFGAVCGVLLGLSLGVPSVVEVFTGETAATSFAIGSGVAFAVPALTAFLLHQGAGTAAYAVNVVGLGLFTGVAFALNLFVFFLDEPVVEDLLAGPTRFAVLGGALIFVTGTVMFTVSMARAKVFHAVPVWGYGVSLTLLAVLAPLGDTVWSSASHILAAASLVWLSATVWSAPGNAEARHRAPVGRPPVPGTG